MPVRFLSYIWIPLPYVIALLIGGGGIFLATNGLRAFTDEGARRLRVKTQQPRIDAFQLETMEAQNLTLAGPDIKDDMITIVEFIYTSCPTICQQAGTYFNQLKQKIAEHDQAQKIRLISVSFDPDNDEVSDLRDYAELHEADGKIWTVARIKSEDLKTLKKQFGLIIIDDGLGGFQHNAAMHVISPQGRLIAIHDLDDVDGVYEWLVNSCCQ